MFTAKADHFKGLLRITANQALNSHDFDCLIDLILREAASLDAGWVAALDLRGMRVEDPFFGDSIKHLQSTLVGCGARKIGTLLDNSTIHMYLGQAGLKTKSNEITQRFFTEKTWEEFLLNPE
jgi:hypothetical protein